MTDEELKQLAEANLRSIQALNEAQERDRQQRERQWERQQQQWEQERQQRERQWEQQQEKNTQLEQLIQGNARSLQAYIDQGVIDREESTRKMAELRQLIDGNARSLQAYIDQEMAAREEERQGQEQIRQAIVKLTEVQSGITKILASIDEDRPTIHSKLDTLDNKINRVLNHLENPEE